MYYVNSYEFEIEVDVLIDRRYTLPATLIANNYFYNFTRKLNSDDDVWFSGTLIGDDNGIINPVFPRIRLSSITCISCLDSELTETVGSMQISLLHLYGFFKYLLNFFFNPLIVFR